MVENENVIAIFITKMKAFNYLGSLLTYKNYIYD
jgi:hypothetical protein